MRLFYWELMNMRQHNYQLTDKWYFETIITELYELAKESPMAKQAEAQKQPIAADTTANTVTKSKFQYLNKTTTGAKSTTSINGNSTTTATTVIQQQPSSSSLQAEQGPLPKITSAVSLAPQVLSGTGISGSLQIRPLGLPASNVVISPPQPAAILSKSLLPSPSQSTVQPIQLPYALPEQTQVSAVKKPNIVTTASNAKSNIKTAMLAAATGVSSTSSVAPTTTIPKSNPNPPPLHPLPKVDLAPMVCINTSIKSTSVGSITVASPRTATPSSGISNNNNNCNTPIASTTTTITLEVATPPAPLPKISGAISLLNPNEILIELIASPNGNHLLVHGPPLSEKYHLSMPTVVKFIREAMAIPLLHNKRHNQPQYLINSYWEHMSNKFNLPGE